MKNVALLSVLFLASSSSIMPAQPKGFDGKWVLDKHSDEPANAPQKLETRIKQGGSGAVTIESRFDEPADGTVPMIYLGLMADKVTLSTDGQEQQNTIGPFQMASKSTLDGNELKTDWTANVNDSSIQGHWTQRLSDDGKHMTWEITENAGDGPETQTTLNFVRK